MVFSGELSAQNREYLEKERMRIIEQIDNTAKILDQTSENKMASLKELELIQNQIENRKKIIDNISESIRLYDEQINKENSRRGKLAKEYNQLLSDYNSLIRMSYKNLLTENKLVYLLSASDWEQSVKRLGYSKSLENYLGRQIYSLQEKTSQIQKLIESVKLKQKEQEKLLAQERENFLGLQKDEKRKDDIYIQLQGDEARLRGALIKQQSDREALNKAIEDVILSQLSDGNLTNERPGSENHNIVNFSSWEKRLPWPVENPSVISAYGKQKHPSLQNVMIQNNGIDILSNNNASVKAIFDGEVVGSTRIPGNDNMVIVRHGVYYSVYSKIKYLSVHKGANVSKGQEIGKLGEANAILHFEIWYDKEKLDPENWLQ